MRNLLLPVCPLFCLALTANAQKQALEVLSLQHLCTPHQQERPPAWRTMLQLLPTGVADSNTDLLQACEVEPAFSPDAVQEMVSSLHQKAIDDNHLHLEVGGTNLIVLGDANEVAAVKSDLDLARDVICRPVQIEFAAWDATDRETPPGVMSAADFEHFSTNRTQLWRTVSTTQPCQPTTLSRERWVKYVRDLNVEVAQKQTVSNPVTDSYCEGGHALVRALPLLGDEFVLQTQFITGQKRGVARTLQTGLPGAADIEMPTLETCYGACSARVPNGGALAVTLRGHPTGGGQLVLTFRITSRQPPQNDIANGVGIFPCAALTTGGLRQRMLAPPVLVSGDVRDGDEQEVFGQLEIGTLQNLLRAAYPAEFEQDNASIRGGNGFLFVRCSADCLNKVRGTLRTLQDQLVRNVQVQQLGVLAPIDGAIGNMSPTLQELSVPTLLGREVVVARLLESSIVRDVNCEIAQEASILDPAIDSLQAGTWMRARVAPAGNAMHAELAIQCTHAPSPTLRTVMPGGGVLMPTDIATSTVEHDGMVTSGQAIDHGDGPSVTLDGRIFRSTLSTTLRW